MPPFWSTLELAHASAPLCCCRPLTPRSTTAVTLKTMARMTLPARPRPKVSRQPLSLHQRRSLLGMQPHHAQITCSTYARVADCLAPDCACLLA